MDNRAREIVEFLREWNENLIAEMCADDKLTCDDLCGCTGDCIVVQAANIIKAQAAEIERLTAELDAAVAGLSKGACPECTHYKDTKKWTYCADRHLCIPDGKHISCRNFEWRGRQKEA